MDTAPLPLLRRNGTKPSCEPCRKLKYSCDHVMPVCERCRRRKIEDQCVYHPGPMRGAASSKQSRPLNRVRKSKEAEPRSLPGVDALRSLTGMRIVSPQDPGFLGHTSHTAILREDPNSAALNSEEPYFGAADTTEPLVSGIGSRRLEEAVAVLRLLRSFDVYERILLTWTEFEMYTSMIEYFVADCTRSVKADLVAVTDLALDDVLEHRAKCLFENTCNRPTIPRTCTMAEFQELFTGASMRWETVGVLFTACGIICCALAPSDPIFRNTSMDKHALLRRLYEASSACISFCEAAGALTDLGIWLHVEHTRLSSQVLGYTHYLVWNHLGATTNHIVSQGLHINTEIDRGTPPWLVEMRRRGVACVYVFDKVLCRFCGRPPRLSQRYCTIHVPLDIAASDLGELATGAPLISIAGSGWNIKGPQEKAYLRCLVMSSRLTEEVLELSLGPPQSDLLSRVVDITTRNQAFLDSLPNELRYTKECDASIYPLQYLMATQEYLGILHNEFMLHRTLCRQLGNSTTELLRLSRSILSIVLEVGRVRSPHPAMSRYAPWITVFFGLPPAGVLAVELHQYKQRPLTSTTDFAWGQVIQDLSVLVSNLKWVYSSGDGNYQLADQARKSLQQILDTVLTESSILEPTISPFGSFSPDPMLDSLFWLNNTEFGTDFWTSLPDNLALP